MVGGVVVGLLKSRGRELPEGVQHHLLPNLYTLFLTSATTSFNHSRRLDD